MATKSIGLLAALAPAMAIRQLMSDVRPDEEAALRALVPPVEPIQQAHAHFRAQIADVSSSAGADCTGHVVPGARPCALGTFSYLVTSTSYFRLSYPNRLL